MTENNNNKKILQEYFEFWYKYNKKENERWFKTLTSHLKYINSIKEKITGNETKENFENIIQEIHENKKQEDISLCKFSKDNKLTLEDFLNTYVYEKDCGIGNIGQGSVYNSDKNSHKDIFNKNIKENFKEFLELFKLNDLKELNNQIEKIFSKEILESKKVNTSKNYMAAKHRLLRTLLPCKITALDSNDKFNSLFNQLKNKLNIKLDEEKENIEKEYELMQIIKCEEKKDKIECCALKQMFYWDLYESLLSLEFDKKNIIYYGAPGTGKTYLAKGNAKKLIDIWKLRTKLNNFNKLINDSELQNNLKKDNLENLIEIVQFHPSFSYEDFIEGIRPDGNGNFKKIDAVFKKFCRKAGKIELALWKNNEFKKKFKDKDFCEIKLKEVRKINDLENDKELKILFEKNLNENLTLDDVIPPFVFVIDEINRAEISNVFGELMFCLEYRGYKGKIKTQYSYLKNNPYDPFFEENESDYFFIPNNIYIIGTMNTIDRSVDIFDFAMRRRFKWERKEVDYDIIKIKLKNIEEQLIKNEDNEQIGKNLANYLERLNKKIEGENLLGRDYQIGHAYLLTFIKCNNLIFNKIKDLKEKIWNDSFEPLLEEYLKGLGLESQISNKLKEMKNEWISKNE
jgi:5-methylcytosine-specific restriction protein B